MKAMPLYLFTDFGYEGPYVGLMHAAVDIQVPGLRAVDLQHDAPAFRPREAGRLLAAQLPWLPRNSLVVAVVDPGVGTDRRGLIVETQRAVLVGPDNGLFAPLLNDALKVRDIEWRPKNRSETFHGRDWFAPVGAMIAQGVYPESTEVQPESCVGYGEPPSLKRVIYEDRFGNLMIGVSADALVQEPVLTVDGVDLTFARTFDDVEPGAPFWYVNSLNLVEIAVNQGSAAKLLGLTVGDEISFR